MKTHKKLSTLLIITMLICLGLSDMIITDGQQQPTSQNLIGSKSTQQKLEKEIYVRQRNGNYYAYRVYSSSGSIMVNLIDSESKQYSFTISTTSATTTLFYRAAYNKFLILQQMTTSDNKTVTYWLLSVSKTIIQSTSTSTYLLDYFAVNSQIDNEGYQFNNSYLLTDIIQYNEITNFLYVVMDTTSDYDVYGIDLANKGNIMIVISYFYYSKIVREKVTGGNSRVLVQSTTDSLWFNTGNLVTQSTASIFKKVKASSLTSYPIYPQSSRSYSFLSSYFQYVSLSSDGLNMTTFIFKDYVQTTTIYGEASLNSACQPIKIISDQQTFFLAIADNDIVISTVTWNATKMDYSVFTTQLTKFFSNQNTVNKWLEVFNSVFVVFLYKGELFMLSESYFYVYSQTGSYEQKLSTPINSTSNQQSTLFKYMKKYLSNK